MSQPFRAGLTFGYRPYGPGSTPSKGLGINLKMICLPRRAVGAP
jgi:hypothetical protein